MTQQDSLTGIHNRRYLDNRLSEELTRYKRKERLFSLLMIDIDNFKYVNDTYGHQFGDIILKKIAHTSSTIIRGSDILARYGGEEFCIAPPRYGQQWGLFLCRTPAKRSGRYTKLFFEEGKEVGVTISIGIAEVGDDIKKVEQLLDHADYALYESKKKR